MASSAWPILAAAVWPPAACFQFDHSTHGAWIRGERLTGRRLELHVERWVWGPQPRPDRIVVEVEARPWMERLYPGSVEPPYLATFVLDKGKWRLDGRMVGAAARSLEEIGTKLADHGRILSGDVTPAPPFATVTVDDGRNSRSQPVAADGTFEILGLPSGRYDVRVTAEGYRQRVGVSALMFGRCALAQVPIEKYGLSERVRDALFPVESYAKAVWSLLSESLASRKGR